MFWKMNHASSAQIDTILCKDDLTLSELLEQESLLQEVVSQNKKLIDFLLRGDIMEELVTLITTEPPSNLPEKERYKQAHIACEVLTSEMPVFNERLASDQSLLARLYAFLQNAHPLNPLLASFFSRTLGVLIARTSEQHWYSYQYSCLQVIEFLKSQEDCIDLFLRHLSTSAIMDLLLKLWLKEKQLIQQVCSKLDPSQTSDDHDNAATILVRIIDSLRKEDDCSVLLASMESEETIRTLLELGLNSSPRTESCVTSCVEILLQLLDVNNNNNEPNKDPGPELKFSGGEDSGIGTESGAATGGGSDPALNPVVDKVITVIIEFMPALHEFLTNPPPAAPIILNSGIIDPPLGFTRLSLIKLLRTLLATQDARIHDACVAYNTFSILFDLFVQYPGNNFLHTEVEKCLCCALAEGNTTRSPLPSLVTSVFVQTRLTSRLLAAYRANEESEGQTNQDMSRRNSRKGYMGHLFSMANFVTTRMSAPIEILLREADLWTPWEDFVAGPLSKTNELHNQCLGGLHPSISTPDNNLDVPFSEDQQVFAADFTSQSGLGAKSSNNFAQEQEEFSSSLRDGVRSDLIRDDITLDRNEELFLKLCDENLADDKNNDVTGLRFNNGFTMPEYWERKWNDLDSSSDEEEDDQPAAAVASSLSYLSLTNPADPWGSSGVINGEQERWADMQEGWANFDPAFSAFEDACGNDTGLPSDLTSTTASATNSHQQDDVNAMSTSISNGLDDHETEEDLDEDKAIEEDKDNVITSLSTSTKPIQSDRDEAIEASNEEEEERSRVNINEIHVIIDEENPATNSVRAQPNPNSSDSAALSHDIGSTQVTVVATIESTPPSIEVTNQSPPSLDSAPSANSSTDPAPANEITSPDPAPAASAANENVSLDSAPSKHSADSPPTNEITSQDPAPEPVLANESPDSAPEVGSTNESS
ncbi:hypothetical protein M8J76_004485 [Diaphorina citri]|nr:hypothetical protein M8J76_004485 [Diaphorina citri]